MPFVSVAAGVHDRASAGRQDVGGFAAEEAEEGHAAPTRGLLGEVAERPPDLVAVPTPYGRRDETEEQSMYRAG
jgi:hypothetical protein